MNLSETQQRLLDELTNEFTKINNQFNKKGVETKLFNPLPVVIEELETVKLLKELEAKNNTMFKQCEQMYDSICQAVNDDIKASEIHGIKIPMRCIKKYANNGGYIYGLEIVPLREDGTERQIDVYESLRIDIELKQVYTKIGNTTMLKYVGFKYGISNTEKLYDSVEEYLNSEYFRERFGKMYRKYCVPRK